MLRKKAYDEKLPDDEPEQLAQAVKLPDERSDDESRLIRACTYATCFMFVEITLGYLSGSIAIFTDAAHMLSDVSGFYISLVALRLARGRANHQYSYGYHQVEVLGALFSVFLVWFMTGGLLERACYRLMDIEEVDAELMLASAIFGLVTNVLLMVTLGHDHGHGHCHGHDHGHDAGLCHGHEDAPSASQSQEQPCAPGGEGVELADMEEGIARAPNQVSAGRNLLLDAAYVHALGDLLQNVGVLAAALLIYFQPGDVGETDGINNWMYADPACTILFSFLVVWSTKQPLMRAIFTIMQRSPAHIDFCEFQRQLLALRHVTAIHDLHIWSIGSGKILSTAHLEIDAGKNCTKVLRACVRIANSFGIYHPTFQLEVEGLFDHKSETFGGIHGHERCCGSKPAQVQEQDDNDTGAELIRGNGCCGRSFFERRNTSTLCGEFGGDDCATCGNDSATLCDANSNTNQRPVRNNRLS
jgi:zinc transporter 2